MNQDITGTLIAWREGDQQAPAHLFTLVYDELCRVAHRQLASARGNRTLDTSGLVHEAYLRLVDQSRAAWADRGHFMAVAARVMRHVVIDYARRQGAARRGGGVERVDLEEGGIASAQKASSLVDLDEALNRLARLDERLSQVVECRFFAGLTEEETGQALGVTARTVRRDWLKAKGWLLDALEA
jgi:RNA polymerase sigma factor (TIGR02999 family)